VTNGPRFISQTDLAQADPQSLKNQLMVLGAGLGVVVQGTGAALWIAKQAEIKAEEES
jgi:hypothetical protein